MVLKRKGLPTLAKRAFWYIGNVIPSIRFMKNLSRKIIITQFSPAQLPFFQLSTCWISLVTTMQVAKMAWLFLWLSLTAFPQFKGSILTWAETRQTSVSGQILVFQCWPLLWSRFLVLDYYFISTVLHNRLPVLDTHVLHSCTSCQTHQDNRLCHSMLLNSTADPKFYSCL